MTDRRVYQQTRCHFCGEPAAWLVWEDDYTMPDCEYMMVCQTHTWTAFS